MAVKIEENLKTALKLLSGKRQHEYGNKKENHENIARLWSAYLDHPLSAHDVAILMLLLKVARASLEIRVPIHTLIWWDTQQLQEN